MPFLWTGFGPAGEPATATPPVLANAPTANTPAPRSAVSMARKAFNMKFVRIVIAVPTG